MVNGSRFTVRSSRVRAPLTPLVTSHFSPVTIHSQSLRRGMDRLTVWHRFALGHFVIDPFPFAFHFHTPLRGWMAKAGIHFRQRALTDLIQYDHSHGSFFVRGRIGHRVSVTAG